MLGLLLLLLFFFCQWKEKWKGGGELEGRKIPSNEILSGM